MGFRFFKSFSLGKLLRLNVSKSGVSLSVGVPGAGINISKNGITANAGIPGTGLSYRHKIGKAESEKTGRKSK